MEEYLEAMHGLAVDIAEKISKGYIVGSTSEQVMDFKDWQYTFNINKYHFSPKSLGHIGIPPHTDAGFVTIIQEDDDVGGLELFHPPSNSFVPCTHLPGSLFINTGDVAHVSFFSILFIDVPNPM